jgi:hypothetical protein
VRTAVIDKLFSCQESDGSFGNPLSTALAACTLLNFDQRTPVLRRAVEFLLATQQDDGSWPRIPFFADSVSYYGSEELTAAFCVEALSRFSAGGLNRPVAPHPR